MSVFTHCFPLPPEMFNIFSVLHEVGISSQALLKSCQEETLEQGMGKKGTGLQFLKCRPDIKTEEKWTNVLHLVSYLRQVGSGSNRAQLPEEAKARFQTFCSWNPHLTGRPLHPRSVSELLGGGVLMLPPHSYSLHLEWETFHTWSLYQPEYVPSWLPNAL